MRQQVVKSPLKINVIMKALRGGLSGPGSDRRREGEEEEEEEGVASIMFHRQNAILTQQVVNKQGLPAAFHQQL